MKILVVDDNADAASILTLVLESLGHEVESVHSGSAALLMVEALTLDVVIIDLLMPNMDGLEATRRIHVKHPNLPILAISGIPTMEDAADQQHLFPHGVIHKPFLVDDIRNALERIHPATGEH